MGSEKTEQTWSLLKMVKERANIIYGLISVIVAIGGLVWTGANLFATDKEVEAEIAKVEQRIDNYVDRKTLYDARLALKQVQFQLLDTSISPAQRALAEETKKDLQRVIKCVQEDNEHCEQ